MAELAMLVPLRSEPALIDQVYGRLLEAISNGSLPPPGERLTQERVARLKPDSIAYAVTSGDSHEFNQRSDKAI